MTRRNENISGGHVSVMRFERGKIFPVEHEPVREYPLTLIVNGRELVTLVSSPHELDFLVAGYLFFQGIVKKSDDFQMLSICEDFGSANVTVTGELPAKITPALSSGGSAGFSVQRQERPESQSIGWSADGQHIFPDDLFHLMEQMTRQCGDLRKTGVFHSAAVGEGRQLILYSEDIGRHNALDRLAGEALLKGIDLTGKVLLVSGRVSSETVTKAAMMGITLIASRTSPTDRAVRLAHDRGMALVGCLGGSGFTIHAHPEIFAPSPADQLTEGVTAVILAGGNSSRMKSNKALLPYSGELFIERIHRQLAELFREVILVTNTPEIYRFLPCRIVQDIYPAKCSLAGIHAGLAHSANPYIFTVACDMPYLNPGLIRLILSRRNGFDVVIPESEGGLEPLHALYGKGCLPAMEKALAGGCGRIVDCFDPQKVAVVSREDVAGLDPAFLSFRNINTPEEYFRFRDEMQLQREENGEEGSFTFVDSSRR